MATKTITKYGDVILAVCPFCGLNFVESGKARPIHFERKCAGYHELPECPYTGFDFEKSGVSPREYYENSECEIYE